MNETSRSNGLRASLTLWDTTMLVMGGIVGAGIFFAPKRVAEVQPSFEGILLVWGLGGLIALTGAFVFAELGGLFPRTGGQYVYIREAFGKPLAFFFGWNLLTIVNSGALAVVASISVFNLELVLQHIGITLPPWGATAIGVAMLLTFTIVNIRGVKLGARVHNVFMALKILSILLIIALGIGWLFGPDSEREWNPGEGGVRWGALAVAGLSVMFSYGGWQNAAAVAGEVRDAARVLPKAIVLGTICVVILYLGLNLSVVALLGVETLASTNTPVADAAGTVLGTAGEVLVAVMIVLSTLGITHALLLMTPRIYYAMARDGVFFKVFGKTHARFATPVVAIAVQGILAILHLVIAETVSGYDIGKTLDGLVFADWIGYSLVAVAYFVFRVRLPNRERTYRAAGHPWLPGTFLALCLAVVFETVRTADSSVLWMPAVLFVVGGVLLFFFMWRTRSE